MIVRIGCTYSYDMDFNDYEEGERICIDKNAILAGFTILDNPDDDEALDGREGTLSADFEYELHDGQLCAVIDGKYVLCEDDYEFEQRLRAMGNCDFLSQRTKGGGCIFLLFLRARLVNYKIQGRLKYGF